MGVWMTRPSRSIEPGRALFNSGRYFEAHEVWEALWLAETGERRRLLQGLIQLAAALYKASEGGSARGCVRLLDTGIAKLDGIRDERAGLALARLRREVREFRARAESWMLGESPAPGRPFPKLHLRARAAAARTPPSRRGSTRRT